MIIACAGCHLHWLAVVLLPIALWVFKIFRHKGGKCPCDCHKKPRKKYLTEGYQPKGNASVPKEVPNLQSAHKLIEEIDKENLELIKKIQPK
jgi:hypothetical protein